MIYVASKRQLTVDERIKKEVRRLKRIYKNIDKDNKAIIDRADPAGCIYEGG